MIRRDLTDKQQEVLDLLVQKVETEGQFPSLREVQGALDYKSTNSVFQIMQALRKKGYLVKDGDYYDFAREDFFLSPTRLKSLRKLYYEVLAELGKQYKKRNLDPDYIHQRIEQYSGSLEELLSA